MISLLLPAGGIGARFGATIPKQLLLLAGVPIIRRSIDAFAGIADEAIVAAPADRIADVVAACAGSRIPVQVVPGGTTRQQSVHAALRASRGDLILVHDAVRPLVQRASIDACIRALTDVDGAVVAVPCAATIKRAGQDRQIAATVPREGLWLAQTPQGFRRAAGLAAFAQAEAEHWACTDDGEVLERAGFRVVLVPGNACNLKITEPADLALAEAILQAKTTV
ncbi:MAG: 2-C-methyl-D-erythritol 4-phosphate cytidylyltransferase [Planctomycetota bacterium]